MHQRITKNSLGIFWDGTECDGILLYGYWNVPPPFPDSSFIYRFMPESIFKVRKLFGPGWTVWMWEIVINNWPENSLWNSIIEKMFDSVLNQGAKLSWFGLEGGFIDPPNLFSSKSNNGSAWAFKTSTGIYIHPPGLDESFSTINEGVIDIAYNAIQE